MTTSETPVIAYNSGGLGSTCPLCRTRPATKSIYGYPACKKCVYAFANRRQGAYIIDATLGTLINVSVVLGLYGVLGDSILFAIAVYAFDIPFLCLFACKDGFNGYSLGKKICGVQVVELQSQKPTGFLPSFKRNLFLPIGIVPYLGSIITFVMVVIIAVQEGKGFRLFDRFAGTRVIWKKYAHLPMFGGASIMCEACGYDLTGNTSGTCPECGVQVSERIRILLAQPVAESTLAPTEG